MMCVSHGLLNLLGFDMGDDDTLHDTMKLHAAALTLQQTQLTRIETAIGHISATLSSLAKRVELIYLATSAKVDTLSAKVDGLSVQAAELGVQLTVFIRSVISDLGEIESRLDRIESELNAPPSDDVAVSARVIVPTYRDISTGKTILMPQSILNDVVTIFPVEFDNLAGQPVPAPASGDITVTLVDGSGAVSTMGTVALEPDGTSFAITPSSPIGSATGDATVKYDDMVNGGTPNDISFSFDVTFGNDPTAQSAHVDTGNITTRPFPGP